MRTLPTIQELREYSVNRQDEFEVTRQTLYDSATYAAAGQTSLILFQQPKGQGGKTFADTNMESAGQLPAPKHFLIESIEIRFFPGVNPVTLETTPETTASNFANDTYTFQQNGFLDLFIGSKSYLTEAPLGKFPPKTKLDADFAYSPASDQTNTVRADYATMCGRPYFIDPHITLIPTQNFQITLNWPTAVALPSAQDARLQVAFDGLLYRLSQ